MERVNLNSNEKLSRIATGIESDATHFVVNDIKAVDAIKNETVNKFNQQVDEYVDKFNQHAETLGEYVQGIKENMHNLEIMPIYNYILVKPYSENPFQRITVSKDSGLITDLGGAKPIFKNPDNGEYEEEENLIHVGTVLESGKECKYVKEGDVIMWPETSEVPVPFFKQGLVLVNENRVIVVINEGLKERFGL